MYWQGLSTVCSIYCTQLSVVIRNINIKQYCIPLISMYSGSVSVGDSLGGKSHMPVMFILQYNKETTTLRPQCYDISLAIV